MVASLTWQPSKDWLFPVDWLSVGRPRNQVNILIANNSSFLGHNLMLIGTIG
jgi:hypothetical protein